MAWDDTPPTKEELSSAPATSNWDATPPTQEELGSASDPHKYFTNGSFDSQKWLADQPKETGPDREEALLRGGAQGATLGAQPMLSPILERAYAKLFGDKATNELYDNLSNDDLKKTYVEQNQAAMKAHPGMYVGGQVLGSLPAALATGGATSEAAAGLGAKLGLGALAPAVAEGIPAATGLAKAGLVGLNAAGQAATQGTLGAIQGYNANPLASDAERLASAEKVGGTSAALAGPLAAAAPYAPVAARTIGGGLLGAGAANITNPLHPTLAKTALGFGLGAGLANAAPAAIDKFGIANDLADANQFGKQGVSLINKGDVNRVQGAVSDLAGQVSKSIGDLDQKVTAPAIEHIQDSYQAALESLTKDLNATPEQASQIIQNGQSSAIQKLESLMQAAQEQGKTVSTGNVIQALTEQLKQDISSSGTVVGDVDRKTVENAIGNLNGYLTKQGLPINIKSSTILNSEGKPFLSNLQVAGKNLTADEVKDLINPKTGQLDPAKIQGLGGPNAQVNPVSSSVKTTQMSGNNPQGQLIPNTSMQPPAEQIPMGEISPEQLESGNAMQTVPGQEPDSGARPMFTQIDAKQQVVPQEPQSGEMSVPEAQNLKRLLGKMGYDSSSIPDEVKGSFIGANQDINKIITQAFQPSEEGAVNPYAQSNQVLTAVHDLSKIAGVPTKLYSTGQQIPPAQLQNIIKGVQSSLVDADQTKFQQVVKLLAVIDPEGAQSFANNVKNLSGQIADLKGAGSNPLEQQAATSDYLKTLGVEDPALTEAGQNLKQMDTIKNTAGGPSSDIDAEGNPLPEDKTYKFIKNLGQAGPTDKIRSEVEPAVKDAMDNTIELLRKFDPELVNNLETNGKSVARQNELLENNSVHPKSLVGRTGYFIKQGLVRGSNAIGQAQTAASQIPVVSPFFKALPTMIQAGAPILGKYGPALAVAYKRGDSALTATNYSLMQSDPQFRMINDQFNEKFQ